MLADLAPQMAELILKHFDPYKYNDCDRVWCRICGVGGLDVTKPFPEHRPSCLCAPGGLIDQIEAEYIALCMANKVAETTE